MTAREQREARDDVQRRYDGHRGHRRRPRGDRLRGRRIPAPGPRRRDGRPAPAALRGDRPEPADPLTWREASARPSGRAGSHAVTWSRSPWWRSRCCCSSSPARSASARRGCRPGCWSLGGIDAQQIGTAVLVRIDGHLAGVSLAAGCSIGPLLAILTLCCAPFVWYRSMPVSRVAVSVAQLRRRAGARQRDPDRRDHPLDA
ncbi:hypothetical protein G5V59_16400 [Nocardioides sp. W3-2-3]|uniref:hypothetical protein n=1 Tax=Nocardioides convexus TaxID=2712224 RepID=UPI0024189873|nr:hypothetical protein [Nocardioides convexus]NHA00952.1 hypothetical protein [Nocardioides convexus]